MYLFHILLGVGVKLVFISGDFQMANMYLFRTIFHVNKCFLAKFETNVQAYISRLKNSQSVL